MGKDPAFVKKAILSTGHIVNILSLKCKAYRKVGRLQAFGLKSDEPIPWDELDKSALKSMHFMQKWADKFGCAWFKFVGEVPEAAKGKKVVARIKLQGEGLVRDKDGNILQGITQVLSKGDLFHCTIGKQIIDITDCAAGGEKIELYVDAGFNGKLRFDSLAAHLRRCDIAIRDDETVGYYYDYIQAYFLMCKLHGDYNGKEGDIAAKAIARARELDAALKASYKTYKDKGVQAARAQLQETVFKPIDYPAVTHSAIGHAHIDLAWLWPIRETKRKVARTFANQLLNISKYDDYIFGASQPQMFEWLKQDYPQLFGKVKEQIDAGRIELQGGMWVESDCNLPCGESWIRQFMYGKKYFMQEFGKDIKTCWLPDAFGFPATLPQVIKGCGMDYFMTIKLISNTINQFPYKTFNWQGLDGTEVLAHMEPAGDYNSGASPLAIFKSDVRNTEKDIVPECLLIYGDGDGGGGPSEGHLEYCTRMKKGISGLSPLKFQSALQCFNDLEQFRQVIPTHKGELYYERHQGTYTSQAAAKLWNRRMESMLHFMEMLGAYAYLKGIRYDRREVEKIWKETLLYQFHDVLPGSSIKRVYDESRARYKEMHRKLQAMCSDLLAKLSRGGCDEYTAVNPIAFAREEYIKAQDKWYSVSVAPMSSGKLLPAPAATSLEFDDDSIGNGLVKLRFDKKGAITSCYMIKDGKELVKDGGCFNRLNIYDDPFMFYNAWDIRMDYDSRKPHALKLTDSKTYIDGVRVVRENRFKWGESQFTQTVSLTQGDTLISFEMDADWHEELKMLRADFTPSVFSDTVKCDIQFGSVDRTTRNDDSVQRAQFEICAHKYVNLDGDDYGLALLNRCKYGHKVKEGMLSLALLRSPVFPDPECDRGKHHIGYALYPHKDSFDSSDVIAKSYRYNNPVILHKSDAALPSIATCDKGNIIIETVKVAESESGIILRAYEANGKETAAAITFVRTDAKASECDMLENPIRKCDLSQLTFRPHEIKTILIEV